MKEQFIRLVTAALEAERFTLVDIGCSGGIERVWREYGDRLAGVGFDAGVAECRRPAAEETNPNVHYVPGFVDIPPDHPFAQRGKYPKLLRSSGGETPPFHRHCISSACRINLR